MLNESTLSASTQEPEPTRRTTQDLTKAERHLVQLMAEVQFGRFENLQIRAGQPILNDDVKVVRVARLGGESGSTLVLRTDEFELKRAVCDLLDRLTELENGTILKLEFRHGLPNLLEVTACTIHEGWSE